MTIDEDKRRDSKRENAHLGQTRFGAMLRLCTNVQRADDLGPLPADLDAELRRLEHLFAVDAAKLRAISAHFENELRRGLSRYGSDERHCMLYFAKSATEYQDAYCPVLLPVKAPLRVLILASIHSPVRLVIPARQHPFRKQFTRD
jgi:hypothetical protein